MAESKFSGDIIGVSEQQLEFIDKTLKEQGFKGEKLVFTPVGKVGDNYVANVKRITIETEDGAKQIIAKLAPGNPAQRMATNVHRLFKNEEVMYTKVLPKLTELQKKADTPERDMLRYAKCYGSLCEEPNEVILLKDLTTSDYTMLNRMESLSDACVRSVLKNLGIFHSLSYALKKEDAGTFKDLTADLVDVWAFSETYDAMMAYFKQMEQEVLAVLDDEDHKNIVRHKLSEVINIARKLSNTDIGTKYTIIQQGDAWTNNIMFKIHGTLADNEPFPENNGKLVSSNATSVAFSIVDGGGTSIYILVIQQIINDLADMTDRTSQSLALGQTLAVLSQLSTGLPGDACAAANVIDAYVSGNSSAVRKAVGGYINNLIDSVDVIVRLANNPNAARYTVGLRGQCEGGGRNYPIDEAWSAIADTSSGPQSRYINELSSYSKRLFSSSEVQSNNVAAYVTATAVPQVVKVIEFAAEPLARFLASIGNGNAGAYAVAAQKALSRGLNSL